MTEQMVPQAPQSESEEFRLTSHDRCDACGAQAYVAVKIGGSELYFCAHHANQHKEKLSEVAIEWHDETDRLTAGAGVN